MKKINNFIVNNLHWLIVTGVAVLCAIFLITGQKAEDGSITLNGKNAEIQDYTNKFIEDANAAIYRITNEDVPTDEETINEYKNGGDARGLGGSATLETVIGRREPDGFNDDGKGLQCSKYTAYLATGRMEYSYTHPDYGPVNGKNVAQWLVDNFGWKYIDEPVTGAIGSGWFNTLYGHTAMFLYWMNDGTAMVNDANYVPLTVATHPINASDWVWVVPGDYIPDPTPTPTPTPTPSGNITYSYVPGDYFSNVLIKLGLDEGHLWGVNGTVDYYTKQLVEQNVLDMNGNVLLYTPFKLVRR